MRLQSMTPALRFSGAADLKMLAASDAMEKLLAEKGLTPKTGISGFGASMYGKDKGINVYVRDGQVQLKVEKILRDLNPADKGPLKFKTYRVHLQIIGNVGPEKL